MADKLTRAKRSENMRRIGSKGTKPELIVRRLVAALGFRYRLHRNDLPGRPDLAFLRKKKAIFVHGCFWHQHTECREGRMPGSRHEYWLPKLEGNVQRDLRNVNALVDMGWQTLTIWECQIKDETATRESIRKFLTD
jgi:DNA mismatch endonuclease (patch repair protein)